MAGYMPQYMAQQYFQQQPMQQPVQPQVQYNDINWVQGEAGAKSAFVGPGQTRLFMDSEAKRFYIKTADMSGLPMPLRRFSYTEETDQQPIQDDVVRRNEFDALKALVEKIQGGVSNAESAV